jgi:hypothetical protein
VLSFAPQHSARANYGYVCYYAALCWIGQRLRLYGARALPSRAAPHHHLSTHNRCRSTTSPCFVLCNVASACSRRRYDEYVSLEAFAAGVRSVFENAIAYHITAAATARAPSPHIGAAAQRLLLRFEAAVAALVDALAPVDREAARLAALAPSAATLVVVPPPMASAGLFVLSLACVCMCARKVALARALVCFVLCAHAPVWVSHGRVVCCLSVAVAREHRAHLVSGRGFA